MSSSREDKAVRPNGSASDVLYRRNQREKNNTDGRRDVATQKKVPQRLVNGRPYYPPAM